MKAQSVINIRNFAKFTPIVITLPCSAMALSEECPSSSAIETIECKQEKWDAAEKDLEIILNHTTGILIKDLTEAFATQVADDIKRISKIRKAIDWSVERNVLLLMVPCGPLHPLGQDIRHLNA